MLPDLHRRSPRIPTTPATKPRGFDFDAFDEQKTSSSKKILFFLAGLLVVAVIIFFVYPSSTESDVLEPELLKPEVPKQPAQPVRPPEPEDSNPSPAHNPAPAPTRHLEAINVLTRLQKRMREGKFTNADYRDMVQKVMKMYPDENIPPHLFAAPAPHPPMGDEGELDLNFRRDRRGKLKNLATNLCLTRLKPFTLEPCEIALEFFYSGDLGRIQLLNAAQPPICLEARVVHVHEAAVWTYPCHTEGGNQKWSYNPHTQMLKHLHGLCLASSPHYEPNKLPMVSVLPCDERLTSEQWIFD